MISSRLQKIDSLLLPDHFYLSEDDACYFYGEYTARGSFRGEMNSLIYNLKKSPKEYKNTPMWRFKEQKIQDVANIFTKLENWGKMQNCVWIPVPLSKLENDPEYDTRLIDILKTIKNLSPSFSFCPLIKIKRGRTPAHDIKEGRPRPDAHYENFVIDEKFAFRDPKCIIVFDDLLTTGATFKAMKRILGERFGNKTIFGVFIARTRREAHFDSLDKQ